MDIIGTFGGEICLGKSSSKSENDMRDNIKIDLTKMDFEDQTCMEPAQDCVQRWLFFCISLNSRSF
jgi:hypothetical protein